MATATPPRKQRNLAESHRKVRHPLQKLRGYIRSYLGIEGAATLVLFGVMAILHDYAGWRFYVRGEGYGPFAGDA